MKAFKKNIEKINLPDKAAHSIAKIILQAQSWFAFYLQRATKNWKQQQQWIFLYSVCVVFSVIYLVAMVHSFKTTDGLLPIMPRSISIPKDSYKKSNSFFITENEYKKVQQYKQAHPDLIKKSPVLFDYLTLVEQAYYSQKKQFK